MRSFKRPRISSRGEPLPAPGRRAIWCFRLGALLLGPLLFLVLAEVGLRLAGYGYPTRFLKALEFEGTSWWTQNNQFGWRFFGPHMARSPYPISVPRLKAPGTIRVFVFGESAAYGDPEPRFGLPRMLQAMLSLRYTGVRFEVINAAMTGINSHAILPLARDCLEAEGDIWVLYMGNNEVVGPFGAGTVFGPKTPPDWMVRARLAFLNARLGQATDAALRRVRPAPLDQSEWGGMKMFLDHPVPLDDPALQAVYIRFARNLERIMEVARRAGVGLVVSTVAVNLRDCAPFASTAHPGLSDAARGQWEQHFRHALQRLEAGDFPAAAASLAQAARIDADRAELRFLQGECASQLGQPQEAERHFVAARDLDTLRFRCDSQLNNRIRQAVAGREQDRIRLVDSARVFAENSPGGLPGRELFCDHVHFTFEGTYLLARTIGEQVEQLLPESVRAKGSPNQPWPSATACAERLAWSSSSQYAFLQEVWKRQNEPPFTAQFNHAARQARLASRLREAANALRDGGHSAKAACQTALAAAPDDPELWLQLATLRLEAGDAAGAEGAARKALSRWPSSSEAWAKLGRILAARTRWADAAACFRGALQLDSQDVWSRQNLAQALVKLGQREAALREYRRAVKLKPRFGLGWLGLGQLLEEMGETEEAAQCYGRALAHPIHRPAELLLVARFCQKRGWWEAAVTNYSRAIPLNPLDPQPYLELGQSLTTLGRHEEAANRYAELVQLAPAMAEAHFLYGAALGRSGRPQLAVRHFREAARLKPDLLEARLNLGIALMNAGNSAEALAQFQAVLERDPSNALALRHEAALRQALGSEQNSP